MKAFIHCALAFLFLSTQVMASPVNGLKEAIDELNYSLTVEWDQADPAFYEEQKEIFKQRVVALSEQGASNDQLMHTALQLVKDEGQKKEVEVLFSKILNGQMDDESMANSIMNLSENMYSSGASWNGRTTIAVIAIVAVAAVASIVYANINTSRGNIKH